MLELAFQIFFFADFILTAGFYNNILWRWPILSYHAYFTCVNISDIPWISNIFFFWNCFVIFAFLWSVNIMNLIYFFGNRLICIHATYIFSGLIFDFLYLPFSLTLFVYVQYTCMIKSNNSWSRDYVMEYINTNGTSTIFCSKMKKCNILQVAD